MNIISSQTLHQELLNLFPSATITPPRDARYACPSESWLTHDFAEYVRREIQTKYVAEKFDCDDFTLETICLATKALNETAELRSCGHTIGMSYVMVKGNLNGVRDSFHACNLVRLDDGRWVFFEPQNQRMTDANIAIRDGVATPTFFFF
jgi:hypothetical protein